MKKEDIQRRIDEIEAGMAMSDFWNDKDKAQADIKELQELKTELEGGSKYDAGDAIMTIFAGAGGDDAEDFSAMLFIMYRKYFDTRGWGYSILHENKNDQESFLNLALFDTPSHQQLEVDTSTKAFQQLLPKEFLK